MPAPDRPGLTSWNGPTTRLVTRRGLLRLIVAGGIAAPMLHPLAVAAQTVAPVPSPAPPSPVPSPTPLPPALGPQPAWVQALRPIPLWSGPDDEAIQLGTGARWDYFQIAKPPQGPRLNVLVARSKNYAWVDALAVGPSGPPPPGWPPPDAEVPPDDLSVGWVATVSETPLWADPDGTLAVGLVPPFTAFKQLEPQSGPRLVVQDPYSAATAYLLASAVGPVNAPRQIEVPARWWGIVGIDEANVRAGPTTREPPLAQLGRGTPAVVVAWTAGEEVVRDNPTWAQIADGAFVHSSVLRPVALPSAPPPPEGAPEGSWIDVNLTHQVVTAYEKGTALYVARTSTGRPGWETAPGLYRIQRRVEKETMDSNTLIGLDAARADYKIENIRWTQYFTNDGKALHENYWKPRDEFGIPSSHGCVGLVAEDARFFWEWAGLGTPLLVHA